MKQNIKEHNLNWPQFSDHPYRILIIRASASGKTNTLFNLISHLPDNDKIHLYVKGPYETKYQLLTNKRKSTSLNNMDDVQTLWIMLLKILKNTIQIRNAKY